MRTRGVEISYIKRISKWFNGQVSASFSRVTGQSASSSETLNDILNTGNREDTREYPMPWDTPMDLKFNALFVCDNELGLFNKVSKLNHFKLYVEGNYRSGRRYTPYLLQGYEPISGRPIYEINADPTALNSEIGTNWFWADLSFQKWWTINKKVTITYKLEITNVLNNLNAAIINPVTGKGYEFGDDLPSSYRDPRFLDPRDPRSYGTPPDNPAHLATSTPFYYRDSGFFLALYLNGESGSFLMWL